ncbi:LCP family protein [Brevibacterium spongiae]|uniref:LCP family protein n=1 Tax=Brevibacterium spongiae TaxID=2909672 RepID=A0ABY5SRH3_9MICO|nr:LCP family protein [Brevibacterium spongiae]UVI35778.1 LCP family protein [Brevibacterium spongiae]
MRKRTAVLCAGITVVALLVFGAGVGAYNGYLAMAWDRGVTTIDDPDLVEQLASQPEAPTSRSSSPVDILLFGTVDPQTETGAAGADEIDSDLVMLAHIPADRSGVQLVSIPNDTSVSVPGSGRDTIGAAVSLGLPMGVRAVSNLLGTEIDHVVLIDLTMLDTMVDLLGGIEVESTAAFESEGHAFTSGLNLLDSSSALAFFSGHGAFPDGTLQRIHNRQEFIRAAGSQLVSTGHLSDPLKLSAAVRELSPYLSVDSGFDASTLVKFGSQLGAIGEDDIDFITLPAAGDDITGDDSRGGDQGQLRADGYDLEELKRSIADDSVDDFAAEATVRRR